MADVANPVPNPLRKLKSLSYFTCPKQLLRKLGIKRIGKKVP